MLHRNGRTVGFTSAGHAGYGEAGEDIVCSAISALTQTCLLGLTDVVGLDEQTLNWSVDELKGITCILSCDTDEEQQTKAGLLFETMEAGLNSIKASYRRSLKIRHREV